jgi:hypothetical protein
VAARPSEPNIAGETRQKGASGRPFPILDRKINDLWNPSFCDGEHIGLSTMPVGCDHQRSANALATRTREKAMTALTASHAIRLELLFAKFIGFCAGFCAGARQGGYSSPSHPIPLAGRRH